MDLFLCVYVDVWECTVVSSAVDLCMCLCMYMCVCLYVGVGVYVCIHHSISAHNGSENKIMALEFLKLFFLVTRNFIESDC